MVGYDEMKLVCVADVPEALWVEVASVMVPHGTVSPTDDVVRLVLLKVWMPLLGDRVSDVSVTLDADRLEEAVFAGLRLVVMGRRPVVPAGMWLGAAGVVVEMSGPCVDGVCVLWEVIPRPGGVDIEIIPGAGVLEVESISEGLEGRTVLGSDVRILEVIEEAIMSDGKTVPLPVGDMVGWEDAVLTVSLGLSLIGLRVTSPEFVIVIAEDGSPA